MSRDISPSLHGQCLAVGAADFEEGAGGAANGREEVDDETRNFC
jgi:hypothetical protein